MQIVKFCFVLLVKCDVIHLESPINALFALGGIAGIAPKKLEAMSATHSV